jgi:hypothetical protein
VANNGITAPRSDTARGAQQSVSVAFGPLGSAVPRGVLTPSRRSARPTASAPLLHTVCLEMAAVVTKRAVAAPAASVTLVINGASRATEEYVDEWFPVVALAPRRLVFAATSTTLPSLLISPMHAQYFGVSLSDGWRVAEERVRVPRDAVCEADRSHVGVTEGVPDTVAEPDASLECVDVDGFVLVDEALRDDVTEGVRVTVMLSEDVGLDEVVWVRDVLAECDASTLPLNVQVAEDVLVLDGVSL